MPQFDLTTLSSQIFWLALAFGLLFFLLNYYILPKAEYIISHRDNFVSDNLEQVKQYQQDILAVRELLGQNKYDVDRQIEEVKKQSKYAIGKYIDEQEEVLQSDLEAVKDEMQEEFKQIIAEFRVGQEKHIIELAALIIHKVTGRAAESQHIERLSSKMLQKG